MKVIQVSFDTILITLILDEFSIEKIYEVVKEGCSNFDIFLKDGRIFIKWDKNTIEEFRIHDVTNERGIIQFEQH